MVAISQNIKYAIMSGFCKSGHTLITQDTAMVFYPQFTLCWCLVTVELIIGHLEGSSGFQEVSTSYWITWSTWKTGFAKTHHNPARTEFHIIAWHESHTLALSRHTNDRAKDNQVCFHKQHFSDPVNFHDGPYGATGAH